MRALAERSYFFLCRGFGRLLRSGRYSTARLILEDGQERVAKRRRFYAPVLVWMGSPLVRVLDTGVRVVPQREWEERERRAYHDLHGSAVRVDAQGELILPRLPGTTLASLLENPELRDSARKTAIARAVVALAALHARGFTHGDAMAENVLVDPEAGAAHWLDFETVHDTNRSEAWRRADDVRALLATCLLRIAPEQRAGTLHLILDTYADEGVARLVASSFASPLRRPLAFHLAQAGLSLHGFREIARLLRERAAEPG